MPALYNTPHRIIKHIEKVKARAARVIEMTQRKLFKCPKNKYFPFVTLIPGCAYALCTGEHLLHGTFATDGGSQNDELCLLTLSL